jgi:hypothetical protein
MATHTDRPVIPTLSKIERIRNLIEDIDAQLRMARTPLAYIMKAGVAVSPNNADPANGYNTVQEEMVACEDNIAEWDIILDSIHDIEAFSWVKRCERCHDRWAAYIALTAHYLGNAKNEALHDAADNRILNTFNGGENNHFN